jgi:glycosyltransferase involved in cell wall biosynthesis
VTGSVGAVTAAIQALEAFDVAVVPLDLDACGEPGSDQAVAIIGRLAVPVIVVVAGTGFALTGQRREVAGRALRTADTVIARSGPVARDLAARWAIEPGRLVVMPLGTTTPLAAGAPPAGQPMILTWGWLGPGHGIESVIDAMVELQTLQPQPRYRVLGPTDPKVFAKEGESYRHWLMARTITRGVARMVSFDSRELDADELSRCVRQAAAVVFANDWPDQAVSSAVRVAVAAGKPVVTTAFPDAADVLAGGAGLIVPSHSPSAIALALRQLLSVPVINPGPEPDWTTVVPRYHQLITAAAARSKPAPRPFSAPR